MAAPDRLAIVYATDENLAIRASGDFAVLCPDWQKLAYGTDAPSPRDSRGFPRQPRSTLSRQASPHSTSCCSGSRPRCSREVGELLAVDTHPPGD